jgi:hypothetical protein
MVDSPKHPARHGWLLRLLSRVGAVWGVVAQAAPLPDDLRLVVATPDGTQTLHLHKRTARAAACAVYRWSSASGYARVSPEVRTFRGTVEENGNAIVIASIGADQKLKATCIDMEWGHNARWQVSGLDVSGQLSPPDTQASAMPAQTVGLPLNGTPGTPRIGPRVPTGTAPNGVPYGAIVEYELALDLTVAAYTRHGSDLDNVLAAYEADAMLLRVDDAPRPACAGGGADGGDPHREFFRRRPGQREPVGAANRLDYRAPVHQRVGRRVGLGGVLRVGQRHRQGRVQLRGRRPLP